MVVRGEFNMTRIPSFLISLCGFLPISKALLESGETRLLSDLLSRYDRNARPVLNVSTPVKVSVEFTITSITEFSEREQRLTVFGLIGVHWRDEFLTWNPADYNGTTNIVLLPDQLWLPDLTITNSAKQMYDESFYKRFRVAVHSNGDLAWYPSGHISVTCQLHLRTYPFDRQTCLFIFDNWMYYEGSVALRNGTSGIDISIMAPHGEWEITSTKLERSVYPTASDIYSRVVGTIQLKRKSKFYVVNIVAPTVVMSLLSLAVFLLPPESGERISLGITVLLSYSVFSLLVADNLPKTSDETPLLVIYLTSSMGLAGASLLTTVLILRMYHHGPESRVPKWLDILVLRIIGRLVLYSPRRPRMITKTELYKNKLVDELENEMNTGDTEKPSNVSLLRRILDELKEMAEQREQNSRDQKTCEDWRCVATVLDRLFMTLFCLATIVTCVIILEVQPREMMSPN